MNSDYQHDEHDFILIAFLNKFDVFKQNWYYNLLKLPVCY